MRGRLFRGHRGAKMPGPHVSACARDTRSSPGGREASVPAAPGAALAAEWWTCLSLGAQGPVGGWGRRPGGFPCGPHTQVVVPRPAAPRAAPIQGAVFMVAGPPAPPREPGPGLRGLNACDASLAPSLGLPAAGTPGTVLRQPLRLLAFPVAPASPGLRPARGTFRTHFWMKGGEKQTSG